MSRPCEHRHPDPEKTAATCRICHLALTDPAYQRKFGMPVTAARAVEFRPNRESPPCKYRGEQLTGEQCVAVGLPPNRQWFPCGKGHGTRGYACPCAGCGPRCGDYAASDDEDGPAAGRRHCLFHVLPVAGNGAWQRACDQLKWRAGLFTGRKVAAVCTGRAAYHLDPPDAVAEYLPGWEVITVANDPALREVATWRPLWERVAEYQETDEPVFYCHTKAVTRPWNPGVSCHPWARMLFSSLLDFWPVVEAELIRWPIAGSFKKVGRGFTGSRSSWHYSGSFFWVRCSEMFKLGRWLNLDKQWWGAESWPGIHFPPEHAGQVFKAGAVPSLNLYEPRLLFGSILPEFRAWCHANAHRRTREVAHA